MFDIDSVEKERAAYGKACKERPSTQLRDEFAMAALTGLLAAEPYSQSDWHTHHAYEIADAMMEARKK